MDFKNLFKRKVEDKTESRSANCDCFVPYSDGLLFSPFGCAYGSMALSVVYRSVDLISDAIANLPIQVRRKSNGHDENIESHPIALLFKEDKNKTITTHLMMKMMVRDILLKGNGYMYIERALDDTPIALRYLEPKDVQIIWDKVKYKVKYQVPIISARPIEPSNMLHFFKYSYNGVEGISVLSYASRSVDIANQTENSAKQYFSTGGLLSGILTVGTNLSEQQRNQIRNSWMSTYGNGGSGGIAVLQGNMSYQQLSSNAADSQMLESRQFAVKDIARFFGINPVLLGDLSKMSYNTMESVQQDFITNTLQGYLTLIEVELNRKLMVEDELEIHLDETAILKTDKKTTATYYNTMLQSGVLCVDEVRKELGYRPIGATQHIIAYTKIDDNVINNNTNKNTINEDDKED